MASLTKRPRASRSAPKKKPRSTAKKAPRSKSSPTTKKKKTSKTTKRSTPRSARKKPVRKPSTTKTKATKKTAKLARALKRTKQAYLTVRKPKARKPSTSKAFDRAKDAYRSALVASGKSKASAAAYIGHVTRARRGNRALLHAHRNDLLGAKADLGPGSYRFLQRMATTGDPKFEAFMDYADDIGMSEAEAMDEWFSPET